MDLQGAELFALKGLGKYLPNVKYIHTEVSYKEMYLGQVIFKELDDFIFSNNFSIINKLTLQGWQEDAIYKKNKTYDLTTFKRDKYSQRGHDGIIKQIMTILNIEKGVFYRIWSMGWHIFIKLSKFI